ncbi:MAG TPA: endonuclease III [Clostridiales bacterium]|nr:endonuclease III [Clostridiales bacterium]
MKKETAKTICERLEGKYPDPRPALKYRSAYELLVAVILSAQCTDERVNKVTEELFKIADTPEKMAALSAEELGKYIFSCGLYRSKAEHIISASKDIAEKFGGEVPDNLEDLRTLAGVGRKTANVVYSVAFGGDAIAVDTHVFRVSARIGLAKGRNPLDTEEKLMKVIPKKEWSKMHHCLIFHGRETCSARSPKCGDCVLSDVCERNGVK